MNKKLAILSITISILACSFSYANLKQRQSTHNSRADAKQSAYRMPTSQRLDSPRSSTSPTSSVGPEDMVISKLHARG
ncbi:hypothetical protein [Francisella sciaenopsi]|uniref:Lipoprotein n=1 Tax=Francisella sciaenopsi TaxID=3055034 RepID=A0ABQ6PG11_9GAMM